MEKLDKNDARKVDSKTLQYLRDRAIKLIKKLCMRELKQNHTEQEVNINLKIFDLFMSNIDISKLKKDLMIENFFVKKDSFYEESVYLDEILTNRYDKWLTITPPINRVNFIN